LLASYFAVGYLALSPDVAVGLLSVDHAFLPIGIAARFLWRASSKAPPFSPPHFSFHRGFLFPVTLTA